MYPAISERVLRSKQKDAQAFSCKNSVLGQDAFPAGSLVMMRDVAKESKWDALYEGPFTIVRKNRGGAYVLRDQLGFLKRTLPPDHLKIVSRDGEKSVMVGTTHDIKHIIAHRHKKKGNTSYYVEWKDENVEPGWEPVENFNDFSVIRKY